MKRILLLILVLTVLVSGCTSLDDGSTDSTSEVVEPGNLVTVNYVGELENGTVFDTSVEQVAQEEGLYDPARNYEPIAFVAGSGQMIPGFDEAVMGMAVGEEKTVEISPEEAYGEHSLELIFDIPVEQFESANITPVVGEDVSIQGRQCAILNVSEENVTLDCNHQLAGETLIFTIEIVSIEDMEGNSNNIS
ncbi:FKBP-type peptidyl-prolyl cis-trans isomerase [Methanolobus halotolerans]|uniref:Peptidyl-prolyl cis-trans isomerase n=1 Tax=Methanolobus halotolerans TaxID=2052935 RepID=A0A4E0Q3C3_9EURY|nr:peptidylprolyl isomerase [Methanolobus halotolerans]TGC07870.1 peptidylprolyl isomerase [Methanolobus halotolerans]